MRKELLIFCCLIVLSGCMNEQSLIGVYTANYKFGIDTLHLYKDHTFKQNFTANSRQSYSNEGTWKFTSGNRIQLYDYISYIQPIAGKFEKTSIWDSECRKSFSGEVSIVINDDLDYYYIKQSGK
ncbi:MAG TPA: hypothetical protein VN704_02875 [Verrucomicrobiae bacterium]|nr:hypothetical protein [Verrucomicrobiae bacterium]